MKTEPLTHFARTSLLGPSPLLTLWMLTLFFGGAMKMVSLIGPPVEQALREYSRKKALEKSMDDTARTLIVHHMQHGKPAGQSFPGDNINITWDDSRNQWTCFGKTLEDL